MSDLPAPANYNLTDVHSIANSTKVDPLHRLRQKRIHKISSSYSRFDDHLFYPEKERLMKGNDSVSPDKYDPLVALKATQARKRNFASFPKENRNLELKREEKESPSPAKYKVIAEYDIKFTRNMKGATMGTLKRKLEFKVC